MRRHGSRPPAAGRRPPTAPAIEAHLPPAGTVVSVGFEDVSRSWRTRVEHVGGASLTVVAPTRTLGEAIVPEVGRPVIVGWAAADGYFEAESHVLTTGVDTVVTWVLAVARVVRLQRRAAFRIDAAGPATLHLAAGAVPGRLSDVSEGGLGVVVPAATELEPELPVRVSLELEELGGVECDAIVVRVSPGREHGEVDVGLAFAGLDEAQAEDLRRFVFAEQLRRRSLSGR